MTTQEFFNLFDADKNGMAHCPTHDDKKRSLHISAGRNGTVLFDHAGCKPVDILAAKGLKTSDLFVEPAKQKRVIEATYDYRDEDGKLLFQAVRYVGKEFSQRRPDGNGGFIYNLQGVRRVLYRLPELTAADTSEPVFVVEGEKDADRLRAGGLVATCNPMGAGKWRREYADALAGRNVVIVPDNDQPGREHAKAAEQSLRGVAASVKMLTLAGLPEKGDVSDWLDAGHAVEELRKLASAEDTTPDADVERIAISWAELCEMKLERRETILHEVERAEIVMCPAITNRGKTTLWRNVALSLACGRAFAPILPAGPPRSVLYLDFETRLYRARADINKMLGELTQPERALVAANLHIVADCRIKGRPLTLSHPGHLATVELEAQRVEADVIIIDTLTAAFEIADENSNAEAARVMKTLTAMALRLNCVIVFLHHVGKAKLEEGQTAQNVHRARGASAYAGFSHAIFSLLPDQAVQERNTLECSKVKGERFDDTVLKLDPVTRWFSAAGAVAKPVSTYDQVVGIFNGQPLKMQEVKNQFPNLSGRTVEETLKAALKDGVLFQPGRGLYQKTVENPETTYSTPPIGNVEYVESTQPADGVEDSLDFGDWDENGECGTGDYPHPDDFD